MSTTLAATVQFILHHEAYTLHERPVARLIKQTAAEQYMSILYSTGKVGTLYCKRDDELAQPNAVVSVMS